MERIYTELKVTTFKERFNELCESNPQNASRIAENLHVSRQTVSAWRSGYRSPKEPTIIAIAKHFGVTVGWLMGFDVPKLDEESKKGYFVALPPSKEPKTVEARILAKGLDKMPEAQRKAIMTMMEGLYPGFFEEGNENDDT